MFHEPPKTKDIKWFNVSKNVSYTFTLVMQTQEEKDSKDSVHKDINLAGSGDRNNIDVVF